MNKTYLKILAITLILIIAFFVLTIFNPKTKKASQILPNQMASAIDSMNKTSQIKPFSSIESNDFRQLIKQANVVTIDVRTPQEFAENHIEGAINMNFYDPTFADDIGALDKTKTYALYCRSGNRSGQTMSFMESLGFKAVYDLEGGLISEASPGR